MDATPGSKKSLPAAAAAADAVPLAAQHVTEQSSSSPESDATVAGAVRASGGSEDDDDQVERFYALLDNIRTMRGMISTGTAAGRKRARDAEPPWRPAFRMEDFELEEVEVDSDSVVCAGEKKKRGSSAIAKRPADEEEQEEGEAVEAKGPRREQPQSHKARRAGVLEVVDS